MGQHLMFINVPLNEGLKLKRKEGLMKTFEKMDYGSKNDQQFRNNFSSLESKFKVQQVRNQDFVVPWHVVEKDKKKFLVE